MRFTGKVVIVTGAARGQGRASALAFAAEGAAVAVTDILGAELAETAELVRQTGTGAALAALAAVGRAVRGRPQAHPS